MQKELVPYYLSRAVISTMFGIIALKSSGLWWLGLGMALFMLAGFIWYANSGRYLIEPSTPLTPLRRDERGNAIRNRALVHAVAVGGVLFAVLSVLNLGLSLSINASTYAILSAILVYFGVSNWLFSRN